MINNNVKKQYPVIRMPNGHPINATMYNRSDLHGVVYSNDIEFDDVLLSNVITTSTIVANLNVSTTVSSNILSSGLLLGTVTVSKLVNSAISTSSNITADTKLAYNLLSSLTTSSSVVGNLTIPKLVSTSLVSTGTIVADLSVSSATSSLLLDTYPDAAAAYSLRKLRTAYTGSAITVRRSSDNTEQDIGFDVDGNLDTTALTTFVGVGNGFVTTWYDQSGNANNATQTTQANQPQIVSNGTTILLNNKESLQFDSNSDVLITSNSNNFIFNNYFYITHVNSFISYSGYPIVASTSSDGNANNGFWLEYGPNRGFTMYSNRVSRLEDNIVSLTSLSINVQRLFTILQSSNGMKGFFNNTQFGSNNYTGSIGETDRPLYISGNLSGNFANMKMQEIIIYKDDQSLNQNSIQTNINTHYAIY